jgi:aminocarboxymuconate-semialdehyde decarboxylase
MAFPFGTLSSFLEATCRSHAVPAASGGLDRSSQRARVIDTHAHWYPEEWIRAIQTRGGAHGASIRQSDGKLVFSTSTSKMAFTSDFVDLGSRLRKMDGQRVDMHALSLTTPMVDWAPPAFGLELAQIYNDACVAAHLKYPDRFVGMITLPMQAPELALTELERASKLPGLRGVYLPTHVNGTNLNAKPFFPIYAKCEELAWPIFLHPMHPLAANRLEQFYLINLLGNPYETGVAAASLVFGGVLDAFPKLEVMLPHAGGTFPGLIGRLDHGTRVRPELAHMEKVPSAYLRRFSYDTIAHNDEIMNQLVRVVGADRIVLGSDYCFDMGPEQPVDVVERLEALDDEARWRVLGGNAARLLGL